jgi:hypothetical protein
MTDAVKAYDRQKPFKRINNDDIRAKQKPAQANGDGVACGCQIPSAYPDLKKEFDEEFKKFKPGKLQSAIERVQSTVDKASTAAGIVSTLLSSAAAVVAAKSILNVVDDVLKTTDDEIKKLLSQIGSKLAERAIRVMPQWVPVLEGGSNSTVTPDQIIEVEGLAIRSFMNPVDVPFRQWHAWFNWNINIAPEPGYNVRSTATEPPNTDNLDEGIAEVPILPEVPQTIEVQWDTGALWDADTRREMQKGFSNLPYAMETYDGPMFKSDWAWPMTSSYVWAAGRWVYDCSRTTNDTPPKMCTMINPCKAIATARWQAFEFPENELETAVPAIQFMFFTCRRGGYIEHPTITDQDYEFIVDLPHIDLKPPVPFPIGHTPDFPHNTIVMRPRLLLNLNQKPFDIADSKPIEPIIEIIHPDDPQKLPEQVKVRVPLTSLPADTEACGFILSMGWYDPTLEQAAKVKKCDFTFTSYSGIEKVRNSIIRLIRDELKQDEKELMQGIKDAIGKTRIAKVGGDFLVQDIPWLGKVFEDVGAGVVKEFLDLFGELDEEDWLLRMGVNGQWNARYFSGLKQSDIKELRIGPPVHFGLLLSDDDSLSYSTNGADFGPLGVIMRDEAGSRTFKYDDKSPTWTEIVTPDPDPGKARDIRQKMAIAYALNLLGRGSLGFGLGRDNQPLGFLDPKPREIAKEKSLQKIARTFNPIQVGRVGAPFHDEILSAAPHFARALPDQKILVESDHDGDSKIWYSVSIADQDDV